MNVDLSKFLVLTMSMSAPLVTACDLNLPDVESTSGGDTDGGNTDDDDDDDNNDDDDDDDDGTTGGDGMSTGAEGTGAMTDEGTGSDGADEGTGSGGEIDVGNCCDIHGDPGCTIPTIEECVCNADPLCCDTEGGWDEVCVNIVDAEGCGMCPEDPGTGGETAGSMGDCCEVQKTPGCGDPEIEACVCEMDPFCCGEEGGVWDEVCAGEVVRFDCGTC